MSLQTENFTMGVEEEYQILAPQTRQLCTNAQQILPAAQSILGQAVVQPEFRQSQIEIATPICRSLPEVRAQLTRLRHEVIAIAAQNGNRIVAAGTHPFSHWQEQAFTANPHYLELAQKYRGLMHELVTFGCHVHVGIGDREMAVQVMNRARLWLTPLLALSVSSPFWLGTDTGYASYRTQMIARLPMAGPPLVFASYQEYESVVNALVATQIIQRPAQICWDIRLSARFPTLEFRIADMCTTVDEAVMIAGLTRGLVRTCYEQALLNQPYQAVRPELLLAANWCASRSGLESELIDVQTASAIPARELIEVFLEFVRPALQAFGDWDEVCSVVQNTLQRGTSATRQQEIYRRTGSLEAVVDELIQETIPSPIVAQPYSSLMGSEILKL